MMNRIFQHLFKRFQKKNPKKESYFQLLMNPSTIADFARIFNFDSENAMHAPKTIRFKDLEWGSTPEHIKKTFLTPSYIEKRKLKSLDHEVWFYKLKTDELKNITQLHFINNELVVVTRIFRNVLRQNFSKIIEEILSEYEVSSHISTEQYSHVIDTDGNLIHITMDFSVQYQMIGNYEKLKNIIFS